jgi:hypothetical protein
LQQDPFSGCVFLFRNWRGTTVKALVYDGRGFRLCQQAAFPRAVPLVAIQPRCPRMTHDDQPDLPHAQAQHHRAVDDLLAATQALARQQTVALLQRIFPEVAQRLGRSLFDQDARSRG